MGYCRVLLGTAVYYWVLGGIWWYCVHLGVLGVLTGTVGVLQSTGWY